MVAAEIVRSTRDQLDGANVGGINSATKAWNAFLAEQWKTAQGYSEAPGRAMRTFQVSSAAQLPELLKELHVTKRGSIRVDFPESAKPEVVHEQRMVRDFLHKHQGKDLASLQQPLVSLLSESESFKALLNNNDFKNDFASAQDWVEANFTGVSGGVANLRVTDIVSTSPSEAHNQVCGLIASLTEALKRGKGVIITIPQAALNDQEFLSSVRSNLRSNQNLISSNVTVWVGGSGSAIKDMAFECKGLKAMSLAQFLDLEADSPGGAAPNNPPSSPPGSADTSAATTENQQAKPVSEKAGEPGTEKENQAEKLVEEKRVDGTSAAEQEPAGGPEVPPVVVKADEAIATKPKGWKVLKATAYQGALGVGNRVVGAVKSVFARSPNRTHVEVAEQPVTEQQSVESTSSTATEEPVVVEGNVTEQQNAEPDLEARKKLNEIEQAAIKEMRKLMRAWQPLDVDDPKKADLVEAMKKVMDEAFPKPDGTPDEAWYSFDNFKKQKERVAAESQSIAELQKKDSTVGPEASNDTRAQASVRTFDRLRTTTEAEAAFFKSDFKWPAFGRESHYEYRAFEADKTGLTLPSDRDEVVEQIRKSDMPAYLGVRTEPAGVRLFKTPGYKSFISQPSNCTVLHFDSQNGVLPYSLAPNEFDATAIITKSGDTFWLSLRNYFVTEMSDDSRKWIDQNGRRSDIRMDLPFKSEDEAKACLAWLRSDPANNPAALVGGLIPELEQSGWVGKAKARVWQNPTHLKVLGERQSS